MNSLRHGPLQVSSVEKADQVGTNRKMFLDSDLRKRRKFGAHLLSQACMGRFGFLGKL